MSKIVSIHSFRGGTGKSNSVANLGYLLARRGRRVALVDTDIQSPGIHVLFSCQDDGGPTLNDYLWQQAEIDAVARDVGPACDLPAGRLYLVPCSMQMGAITRVLKEGYDVGRLTAGFRRLSTDLALDYLLIDTHPGLNEETLLSIAISDTLVIVLRPDRQDIQGTSVTVEVARRLKTPRIVLLVNKVLARHDANQVGADMEAAYRCPVAAVLPLCEDLMDLASAGLLARTEPQSPWSIGIDRLATVIEEER